MSDNHYSAQLRDIAKAYYRNHIEFESYRAKRKIILDKIDESFNGQYFIETEGQRPDDGVDLMRTSDDYKEADIE